MRLISPVPKEFRKEMPFSLNLIANEVPMAGVANRWKTHCARSESCVGTTTQQVNAVIDGVLFRCPAKPLPGVSPNPLSAEKAP